MICPKCKGSRMVFKKIENTVMLGRCPMCDGLGEIKGTNFQRITESPEALAKWLDEHCDYCKEIQNWQCTDCPYSDKYCTIENQWLDWLMQESDTE